MSLILKTIDLDYTTLDFHENFVESKMKEGTVFSLEQIDNLIAVCSEYFLDKPFVYISRRIHNYNVNPTIYLQLVKVPNLKGIAIVSDKASSLNMAQFEKQFSKIPFEIFLELKDAVKWAKTKIL
ncbi:hypothetical protein [Gillisia marina]|uniref:hypothetical protein n=1 Tax=Gillisia marina TaxID=1167637 RepID=UPI00029B3714|nr:hypothetical protein [Gillisia marina]